MRGTPVRASVRLVFGAVLSAVLLGLSCSPASAQTPAKTTAEWLRSSAGVDRGLCVHVGCGDGSLTAELSHGGNFLVHGLSADAAEVAAARRHIRSLDRYGRVSVSLFSPDRLPYADCQVNVLIVSDLPSASAAGLTPEEMYRVLRPGGVAFLGKGHASHVDLMRAGFEFADFETPWGPTWLRLVRAANLPGADEWTHFEHDAGRSSVSSDRLAGPPQGLRWAAGGRWPPYMVFSHPSPGFISTGGRTFCWVTMHRPGEKKRPWSRLTCRDAYNGLLLWERRIEGGALQHNMVATRHRLYLHLGKRNLLALDVATGRELEKHADTPGCNLLLLSDGVLLQYDGGRNIAATEAQGGRELWRKQFFVRNWHTAQDRLVAAGGRVFFAGRKGKDAPLEIICCDLRTGEERWRAGAAAIVNDPAREESLGLVSCLNGVLLLSNIPRWMKGDPTGDPVVNYAVSAADGRLLWSYEYAATGHGGRATNVFLLGDLVWVKANEGWIGLNAATGKKVRSHEGTTRQQCYPDHATARYIMGGKMDFFDTESGRNMLVPATRSACGHGFMPANGLVYTLLTRCHCFPIVRGYLGLSHTSGLPAPEAIVPATARLERGAVFGESAETSTGDDWPTCRHDALRSGASGTELPDDLGILWQAKVGAGLTAPVVAGGKLFAAEADAHRVLALDADDGRMLWDHTAGGRVDSPPTWEEGLLVFGSTDGRVTCLRASDGAAAWQFLAAPADRRIVVREQLESLWPVHGSVLVRDGRAIFAAGRHTYFDGGLTVQALDLQTGEPAWRTNAGRDSAACLNDILVSDGRSIYMNNSLQFDPGTGKVLLKGAGPVLWAPQSMLVSSAFVPQRGAQDGFRIQWLYADKSGEAAFHKNSAHPRYGRRPGVRGNLLVFRGKSIFGLSQGASEEAWPESMVFGRPDGAAKWTTRMPPAHEAQLTALVLAGGKIAAAGRVAGPEPGGRLWVLSADTGRMLQELPLDGVPRFDGMAAAGGRLYISTEDGDIICLGR